MNRAVTKNAVLVVCVLTVSIYAVSIGLSKQANGAQGREAGQAPSNPSEQTSAPSAIPDETTLGTTTSTNDVSTADGESAQVWVAPTVDGPSAAPPSGFTVHEWGTFTAVAGSDGVLLPGLVLADELLPFFVHSLDGAGDVAPDDSPMLGRSWGKGFLRPQKNVTVKLETPVVYFYAKEAFRARVEVAFNGGSISQWYPERTAGEELPEIETVTDKTGEHVADRSIPDFSKPYQGGLTWDVDVLAPTADDDVAAFKDGENLTWVYPRRPDANLLRGGNDEIEKYLFYRGVGNLRLPLVASAPDDRTILIHNQGNEPIPALFVYDFPRYDDGQVADQWLGFRRLGPLAPGASLTVRRFELSQGTADSVEASPSDTADSGSVDVQASPGGAYSQVRSMLVDAGLSHAEADALIQTWWKSYFQSPGLRVFWIVPRPFVDRVLPIQITPAPQELTRLIVGRTEVLTPHFEATLAAKYNANTDPWLSDRYKLAYEARRAAIQGGGAVGSGAGTR